ncbi:MAG: FAD-dependent oxidoreductase [Chromatiaceae bacterium]|jgi:glutamate synthase (NADPH/NADH) small chain|nr:FAD-dependent oxidoreductase [Chromatiaceae bacterium]
MSRIDYKNAGSILNPLKSLSFFARPAVTEPLEPRRAALRYRGFHLNDWEKCVGCSTCQKVCDNAAITMVRVPSLPEDPLQGVRNLRPAIDYGRCCWCALCVDLCPTGSLSLSREYVHICNDDELSSYFVLPDPNGMHKAFYGEGWNKTAENDLVDPHRQPMGELEAEARIGHFGEILNGYDRQQAIIEASRCVQCGMCHDACPTQMDAPEYIRAIWQDDLEEAVRQIYNTNPFAHTCGRVCTHRCETACSIGKRGEPIAIRWLKRYVVDAFTPQQISTIVGKPALPPSGRKVAVIGSGPAGLTTAYDLARQGHTVTVFEGLDKPGGMPRWGIPEYRLPYDRLDADIAVIEAMGVEIRCNTWIGSDISLQQLHQDYDAVMLALGLQLGRSTRVPGSDHARVVKAVEVLRWVTGGESFDVPRSAVVIGGGNVAMDAARSLARLQRQTYEEVRVTVCALEDFDHFLADPAEVRESTEEGIVILDGRGPQECVIENGTVVGLRTLKVDSIFDEQHRFAPKYDESDRRLHEGEMIIEAIGQMTDTELLGDALTEALAWNRGRLQVDAYGRTSEPWLWAAGDMVHGPDVVHAVADGHRAAHSIHQYLTSEALQETAS